MAKRTHKAGKVALLKLRETQKLRKFRQWNMHFISSSFFRDGL